MREVLERAKATARLAGDESGEFLRSLIEQIVGGELTTEQAQLAVQRERKRRERRWRKEMLERWSQVSCLNIYPDGSMYAFSAPGPRRDSRKERRSLRRAMRVIQRARSR